MSGPTCSGKTALGVRLALHVGGEVVNFDSVQIYRGIEIATAKPALEEMKGVPHHLIGYVEPSIDYTAADWAGDAAETIRDIEARGRTAVLVGGTGFYLRTLRRPLFESPKTDRRLRDRLRELRLKRGSEHLHRMLIRVDPAAAETIQVRDHARTMRALEHFFQTGIRISDVWSERPEPPDLDERIRLFVLRPDRNELYEKINARTAAHFSAGLVDEVKHLLAKGVNEYGNALGAHAYRRVCEYLRGERTLESALERSQQDVRNYAKRQLTWFRKEEEAIWLDGFGDEETVWQQLIERL
ncbi:MAG TPA: tRNA (adenosine(37)-N6)-dimethylallyltransferase MiaA [Pyrinomonadaceae bacterium]|nr:tRNA (adenosine(37)-N6)-dimethylallyltransferase MiaA [Pyrinomonadaceae bacterium]HMP64491.1 tRNA (adenosine(37)-N6)-dimethylallyltransferase MiaA [Pyrinomonadaceae bacterium]